MLQKSKQTKIMVFGTFDGLHAGHLNFFKQARKLAHEPFLIVSVARNINVKKIKGEKPFLNERQRMTLISRCKFVDKVVLSGIKNHIPHIKKERPDIIALGYDQKFYVKDLKKYLEQEGLHVKMSRLEPYKEKIFKNHLLRLKK